MSTYLEFERPIIELENKIEELRHLSNKGDLNIAEEISKLENKKDRLLKQIYSRLTIWQKVQLARHSNRPQFLDYLKELVQDFEPLAGDRNFGEDLAIIGGLGRFKGTAAVIMGHQKGHDTEERLRHNFGMPNPEGYRKARRLLELADRFKLPILTFVDTSGAYPGIEAEERGQSEAIARSIQACLNVNVPLITTIIGEGGSGGAIAIAVGNEVLMLEHAVYSVISPEGCASILWRSAAKAEEAANALRISAQDLYQLGICDEIIEEPLGGAHRQPTKAIEAAGRAIEGALKRQLSLGQSDYKKKRREKFVAIGKNRL